MRSSLLSTSRSLNSVRKPAQSLQNVHIPKRNLVLESGGLIGLVQSSLISLHTLTALPWWGTIGLSTVGLRLALLPLVYRQMVTARRLGRALPELSLLLQLFQQRAREYSANPAQARDPSAHPARLAGALLRGSRACLRLHEVSLPQLLGLPLLSLYVFSLFVFSVRDLVNNGPAELGLETGGALWFCDLSERDGSYLLPLSSLALTYFNLDLSLQASQRSRPLLLVKDALQGLLLLGAPLVCALPGGVFCYWLPNGLLSLAQTLAMKDTRVLKLLRIDEEERKEKK